MIASEERPVSGRCHWVRWRASRPERDIRGSGGLSILPGGSVRLILAIVWMNIGVCLAVTDSITITERAGVSSSNYPVQIGRPFLQGEIPNYPQAVVNGSAVLTQADVKQRYSDGSVKHAILSFLIPSLAANATITVTFQNQTSGNNTPLTTAQMEDPAYNFDAQMALSAPSCPGCSAGTASARAMLDAGAYTYWTSGPVATTVIIADHTTKAYDLGWQNDKVTTLAAKINAGDTTIKVTNASGWTAPMLIRVNGNTTDTSSNLAAEDISICAVNTSTTPNTLTVGTPGSCPSASGRGTTGAYWGSGMSVYPNLWKTAPSSSYKSFRPIFHATFWPGINKVRVRFVGEVADSEKLQDQIYSLALTTWIHRACHRLYQSAVDSSRGYQVDQGILDRRPAFRDTDRSQLPLCCGDALPIQFRYH